MSIRLNNKHVCSGTLIDQQRVLTAAQCIHFALSRSNFEQPFYKINVEVFSEGPRKYYAILRLSRFKNAFLHKQTYDPQINDIGLITVR